MIVALEGNFKLDMFILVHKLRKLWAHERLANTGGRATVVAKIQSQIFKLGDATAHHFYSAFF